MMVVQYRACSLVARNRGNGVGGGRDTLQTCQALEFAHLPHVFESIGAERRSSTVDTLRRPRVLRRVSWPCCATRTPASSAHRVQGSSC